MTEFDSELAAGLPMRFRHLAGELRRAGGHPNADREFERLLFRVSHVMRDAFDMRRLPEPILNVLDHENLFDLSKSPGKNLFWQLHAAFAVVGYWEPHKFVEPIEDLGDGTYYGGDSAIFLQPGPVSLVWPRVFESILCHEGGLGNDPDIQEIFKTALVEQQFTIMGYYATACDLLAEWIEDHANDDHGDHDDRVQPGDGLHCDDTIFVWGGKPYTSIGTTIAPVLRVLMKGYRQGRDSTTDEFEAALGGEIKNGFGSLFSVGKSPNKTTHPVRSVIFPPHGKGRVKYRLINPAEVK